MTELRPDSDPDTAPIPRLRTGERRRAAIALVILAVGAAAFVGILVAALGVGGGSSTPQAHGQPSGPDVTVTGGNHSSSSSHPPPKRRTSTSAAPTGGAVSCPSSAPCALDTDVGNAIGALNTYRTSHGRSAVTGSVTQAAKTCALTSGDQCPSGFYWEPVGRSGTQLIHKIVSSGRDNGQLLDPGLTSVQIGWAYLPASKSFEAALIVPS